MAYIDVTLEVFQPLMSALNVDLLLNAHVISVTRDVSHPGMATNSLVEHIPSTGFVLKHVEMASSKFASVMGVYELGAGLVAAEEGLALSCQFEGGPSCDAPPSVK
jgi:hypothetical protein